MLDQEEVTSFQRRKMLQTSQISTAALDESPEVEIYRKLVRSATETMRVTAAIRTRLPLKDDDCHDEAESCELIIFR